MPVQNKKMRIAFLLLFASRKNAGVFVAASGLARELSKNSDLEIEVFALEDDDTQSDKDQWGHIPVRSFTGSGPASFGYASGMAKAVQDFKPHIIHQHGLWTYSSLITQNLARKTGVHTLISIHGMLTPWALQVSAGKKKAALWLYERRNLASANCIHVLTSTEAGEVRNLKIDSPLCIVPNGIEIPVLTEEKNRSERNELLYVGRLHKIKGLQELLSGWALYQKEKKSQPAHWHLKIVGWGEETYVQTLKEMITTLNIGATVHLAGSKFGSKLHMAYSQADAFILSSHSEAMPMTILEAWSFGLPVIMTKECGLAQGFREGAALETTTRSSDIANILLQMTEMSAKERTEMGLAGRKMVENEYSWNNIATNMYAVYQWLVKNKKQPECITLVAK